MDDKDAFDRWWEWADNWANRVVSFDNLICSH